MARWCGALVCAGVVLWWALVREVVPPALDISRLPRARPDRLACPRCARCSLITWPATRSTAASRLAATSTASCSSQRWGWLAGVKLRAGSALRGPESASVASTLPSRHPCHASASTAGHAALPSAMLLVGHWRRDLLQVHRGEHSCWFTFLGWGGAYAQNWEPIGVGLQARMRLTPWLCLPVLLAHPT